MTVKSFVEAMPKVELNLHLEGGFDIDRLLLIAEQYEVQDTLKHFDDWVALIRKPDYARLYDIVRVANSWIKDAEDLSKLAYDLGTYLYKQNVRYAEVGVCPALYTEVSLDLEGFFAAINDGRDRAERAWGVRMAWILNVPRDEPRRGEDAARWVTSIPAQRAGVVAFGVTGRDDTQAAGQFERPFRAIERRGLPRVVRVGEFTTGQGVLENVQVLNPTRIIDGRGIWETDEALAEFSGSGAVLMVNGTRMVKQRWVASAKELPYRRLIDAGVSLVIGADMPTIYQTTLNQEYILAVEQGAITPTDLVEIALTAIQASSLADDEKTEMAQTFREQYDALLTEHIASETQSS